ncbi:hypothetical protein CKO_01549 [Citrobacter koseri ATCC BAA-895]|uniref:Uncharacterized protein n=1 Tax=Citrobacter koseri (strain ATCC BAA-895 / CDC 4225-83 / SGSC4696) TaxID=290338 RepID=A8AGR8_CITK8|nr:hypothetical protein CKO_01549 [Citrobacter koseri ATCC BAA-895]
MITSLSRLIFGAELFMFLYTPCELMYKNHCVDAFFGEGYTAQVC